MVHRTEAGKNMRDLTDAKSSSSIKEGDQLRDQTGVSPDDELLNVRVIHVDGLFLKIFVYKNAPTLCFRVILGVIPHCTWILVGKTRTCLNSHRSAGSAQ